MSYKNDLQRQKKNFIKFVKKIFFPSSFLHNMSYDEIAALKLSYYIVE